MEIWLVLGVLCAVTTLFVWERFPVDVVALLTLVVLVLLKLVPPDLALSGFSSEATITIAALFVVSAALQRTRSISGLARALIRWGSNRTVLLVLIVLVVSLVSAFINNTATVAIFIPVVLGVCARRRVPAGKLLIPLSYAAQFGGVCTLVGTSTNLLVSTISVQHGLAPLRMFEFAPLGLIMVAGGVIYLVLVGQWLLPDRAATQLTERYRLGDYITELRVLPSSPLIGHSLLERKFGQQHDATVLRMQRGNEDIWPFLREPLRAADVLLVRGSISDLMDLKEEEKLEIQPQFKLRDQSLQSGNLTLVEVLVAPQSSLIGHTLPETDFRGRYRALVVAIRHRDQSLRRKLNQIRLQFGDALLLEISKSEIGQLQSRGDFIVLEELEEHVPPAGKSWVALGIAALTMVGVSSGVVPVAIAALMGALAVVMAKCLAPDQAYRSIEWRVIFMLAGLMPLGIALDRSGAAALLANQALALTGGDSPFLAMAVIYIVTAVLTEIMSNNATAVVMAPIGISAALSLGVSPKPFLMAVCFAASTSFATPIGYQTNTMVYGLGSYRFTDFLRVGIPLNLVFWALALYFIPIFFPF